MCRELISTLIAAFGAIAAIVAQADEPTSFDPESFLKRAAAAFKQADGDGDQQITRDEFLASYTGPDRDERHRRFSEFAADDGKLNRDRFLKLLSPTDERAPLTDPIVELEQAAFAQWRAAIADAWDDGEQGVPRAAWPAKRIAQAVAAVAGVEFETWDKDKDGKVDESEGRWLLEVAYGLGQLDGRPLRTPSGRVLSWYFYRGLDTNHDGILSRDEFLERMFLGKEKNAKLFEKLDADRDAKLTEEETWTFLWHDTLANFFVWDADLDGYLTTNEFLAIGWGKHLGRRSVRAFDDDGDGRVSYAEFRRTTFANQGSDWLTLRRDADDDGRLSWSEFYQEKPPLLIAQARWFFDRFDFDKDGYLSYAELEFDVNPVKVPTETLFAARDLDEDGKLVLTEIFTEQRPPDSDPSALDKYEMRLAAAENRFLADDKDGNGSLDVPEFIDSQQAAIAAARRQSKTLADRKTMLEGNYWVRKGVLIVNEVAFLAAVWWVVRRTRPARAAAPDEQTE